MAFWIAAFVAAAVAALAVVRPLTLARAAVRPRSAHDAQVFRDQLLEVDRDLERGVLNAEEARAARIEISRRLLAADAETRRSTDHQPAPRLASWALALVLLVGTPLLGFGVYTAIGSPDLPDQPITARASGLRPGQEIAEARIGRQPQALPADAAEVASLVKQLEERLAGPNPDPEGLFLLARSYGQLNQFGQAWRTYQRLIDARGGDAPGGIYTAMAEAMIIAAQGYVSPEAEAALTVALQREPGNPVARYYMGAAQAQTNQFFAALETWSGVLRDSPADAPWVPATRAQIEDLVEATGLPMPPIATAPAPSVDDQRRLMLGMVHSLKNRLVADGGTVDEWVQLVRSYAALGAQAEAAEARALALTAFGDDAAAREAFEAGLAETPPPAATHDTGDLRATVAALDARLRAEGGSAGAWLRLIASWQTLGETQRAIEAEAAARAALAGDEAQLAALDGALAGATPAGLRGPTREAVEAAADLPAEDRTAMIRGMVEGLSERLFAQGGSPEEWARLIQSLGVLGDTDAALAAYQEATAAHSGDRIALSFLRETALLAGVTFQ